MHRIGCPKGKVVNSVGAGDSMVAGFVAGYLQSRSYAQALRLGTACGSATAFSLGLATKAERKRRTDATPPAKSAARNLAINALSHKPRAGMPGPT